MCFFVIVLVWVSLSCNSIRFKAATTGGTPTSAFKLSSSLISRWAAPRVTWCIFRSLWTLVL
ncbi:hypothetical protein PR003_g260 [Phytophthora rubi]|uniref:RxLR effector protein n=1 Tax=Phytophthora rubi TaxID=129364 RepID=A0A6A3P7B0_9STRA|nr:hypothetical protein PR002_g482 [Phytophthora rubi]KAE9052777.1 hypothetical protein PR001_g161 [Phytophthora rubi]KAE9360345.1 hypothetical protein PR003_g260 [Phytophthora rubi]